MSIRKISRILESKPTIEGAGVHLKRVFGYNEVSLLDPFLLLDDFHSNRPSDYIAGFPWHPHRGIETVTYMLHGKVKHGDSIGNEGFIEPGDVQWMTAGSGIIHEEMPQLSDLLWGFQLWVNLPASYKMMEPRYQEAFQHRLRQRVELPGVEPFEIWCARPEDIIIGKLMAWAEGGSRKHETDIYEMTVFRYLGIAPQQSATFDEGYVDDGAKALGGEVAALWETIKDAARQEAGLSEV